MAKQGYQGLIVAIPRRQAVDWAQRLTPLAGLMVQALVEDGDWSDKNEDDLPIFGTEIIVRQVIYTVTALQCSRRAGDLLIVAIFYPTPDWTPGKYPDEIK